MKNINWTLLLACIASVVIIGTISGLANAESINTWFVEIRKPSFNPPNRIFGPVWTTLYILMGISFYLILRNPKSTIRSVAIKIFIIQLGLNFCWSFIFFYFQMPGLAFVEIILMWIFIMWMILEFYKISRLAAYLQVPYLLWVTFASILNGSIWYLNS